MAYTQSLLDALKAAYAEGVLTVKHGERVITYDSEAGLKRRIDAIEAELAASSSAPRMTPRFQSASFADE